MTLCKLSSSLVSVVLAFTLVTPLAYPASTWDVSPTPLEQIQAHGLDSSVAALSDVLANNLEDSELRVLAAMALAQLEAYEALPILYRAASDSDVYVRTGVVAALAFLPDSGSIDFLRGVLDSDPDDGPRRNTVTALAVVGTDDAAFAISQAATSQLEPEPTRIAALTFVGQLHFQRALDAIEILLDDSNPNIRAKTAIILATDEDSRYLRNLVDGALDTQVGDHIYLDVVQRLEEISARSFSLRTNGIRSSREEISDWWRQKEQAITVDKLEESE